MATSKAKAKSKDKSSIKTGGNAAFVCQSNGQKVCLAGDFNGWDPETVPMTKSAEGRFEHRLSLLPGTYRYKFVVDGEWQHDPAAAEQLPNEFGTLDSVIRV